jgi:chromosome segregation ATPase
MHISKFVLALAAATLLVTGCAKNKAPASKALESIETSLAEVRTDAAKYAPEGLKGVESQVARLKTSLDNKEYEDVLAGTPQLEKAVATLKQAVASGKAHARSALASAKTEWQGLSSEVPQMVETIEARVDELSKKKRLPWGVSKAEFEGAKSGLDSMKSLWAEAKAEYNKGDAADAVGKAKTVKGMAQEVRANLGIKES